MFMRPLFEYIPCTKPLAPLSTPEQRFRTRLVRCLAAQLDCSESDAGDIAEPWPALMRDCFLAGIDPADAACMVNTCSTREDEQPDTGARSTWDTLTEDERFATLRNMETMGGGFASRLAEAWLRADNTNCARLALAFPDLIEAYRPTGD